MGTILEAATRVLKIEAEAVYSLIHKIDESFERAVELILKAKGKVVITGIGKSGLIGKKIASTLTSTGTPALFLHPAEGLHGDLGVVVKDDVVVAISNSGETNEVIGILPVIKRMGIKLIAMTGNPASTLAKASDVVLDVGVKEEACPLGLAPTASTTATLAMGDALAVALLIKRGFKEEDFALLHPGGSLGRRLLKVSDLMHTGDAIPLVSKDVLIKDAIIEITTKRLGITGVVDGNGFLVGVITDGDLRRALEKGDNILSRPVTEAMTTNPKVIGCDALAAKALERMEAHSITALFVHNGKEERLPIGIIHIHDLLKAGVV